MSYDFDPSEPVRRYRAWEREFELRQARRREPLDQLGSAALAPWSLFTGLMNALREVTGASAAKIAPASHSLRPERVQKMAHSHLSVLGIGADNTSHTVVAPDPGSSCEADDSLVGARRS